MLKIFQYQANTNLLCKFCNDVLGSRSLFVHQVDCFPVVLTVVSSTLSCLINGEGTRVKTTKKGVNTAGLRFSPIKLLDREVNMCYVILFFCALSCGLFYYRKFHILGQKIFLIYSLFKEYTVKNYHK